MKARTILLVAAQRSGTNALRSVISSHPLISAELGEVLYDRENEPTFGTSFFAFLTERVRQDPTCVLPSRRWHLFVEYLSSAPHLTGKPINLIDLKYNSLHLLDEAWRELTAPPTVFKRLRESGLPILHLIRANPIRTIVSEMRAAQLWQYARGLDEEVDHRRIRVDITMLRLRLAQLTGSIQMVRQELEGYPNGLEVVYEDLFGMGDAVDDATEWNLHHPRPIELRHLARIADLIGVDANFDPMPRVHKLTDNRWEWAVENWEEVKKALGGSAFRHFLS